MSHEIQTSVGAGSCNYASLGTYNQNPLLVTGPPNKRPAAVQQIPVYGSYGYNSLTHGQKKGMCCGGFFKLKHAYPFYPNCSSMQIRQC